MFQARFHLPRAAIFIRAAPMPSTVAASKDLRLSTITKGMQPPAIAGPNCLPWWGNPDRTRLPPSYRHWWRNLPGRPMCGPQAVLIHLRWKVAGQA